MVSLVSISSSLPTLLIFALTLAQAPTVQADFGLPIPGLTTSKQTSTDQVTSGQATPGETTTGQETPGEDKPGEWSAVEAFLGRRNFTGCECSGKYASGRVVSPQCSRNATDSTRCVTIYSNQEAIGHDRIPWPAHVTDCATFKDGSRICADDVCAPPLLGQSDAECAMEGGDAHQITVATALDTTGFDFIMDAIKYEAGVIVANLTIADVSTMIPLPELPPLPSMGGVSLTLLDMTLDRFVFPSLSYELLPPSSIKIIAKGGDFKATVGSWSVYKFPVINMGGGAQAWSKDSVGVDVEVTVKITVNEKGQLRLSSTDCKVDVPIAYHFTSSAVGVLANGLQLVLDNFIKNQIGAYVCSMVDDATKNTIPGILDALPTQYQLYDPLGMSYTFRTVTVTNSAVIAQLGVNGTSTVEPVDVVIGANDTSTAGAGDATIVQPVIDGTPVAAAR